MTWEEFKNTVERQMREEGFDGDPEINYIDMTGLEELTVENFHGRLTVWS